MNSICKKLATGMTKKRRVYQTRVLDGRIITSDEIEPIHKEALEFDRSPDGAMRLRFPDRA
jgi:hypothetical protein